MTKEKVYQEGFRLTVSDAGLLIEAIDYHAMPLRLDAAGLAEIGLASRDARRPAAGRRRRPKPGAPPAGD